MSPEKTNLKSNGGRSSSTSRATTHDGKQDDDKKITPVGADNITQVDEKQNGSDGRGASESTSQATPQMREKLAAFYNRKEDNTAGQGPSAGITFIMDKIEKMTEEEALDILTKAIDYHSGDPNFPGDSMRRIKQLVQGRKASGLDDSDYEFDLKAEAAVMHYHSPYPEVRSVTEPFDDPSLPVETIRSYFLGLFFMATSTVLNTFFSPRQPGISVGQSVLQLLIAPCGLFLARVLPDWGFTLFGRRLSLNPGPWSYKEQMFSTIIFSIANGAGATCEHLFPASHCSMLASCI